VTDLTIGIIVGSTRPGRVGHLVGDWVKANATAPGVTFELVDLHDYKLPLLEESFPSPAGSFAGAEANKWAHKVDEFDGYIFVVGEYNHSLPAAIKNALDYVKFEWANKSAGIVSYGSIGGARSAEHLRQIFGELQVADVRQQVMFSLFTDFAGFGTAEVAFTPADMKVAELDTLVEQVVSWGGALRSVRELAAEEQAAA